MKLPTEIEMFDGDTAFRVRFDYDRGEDQWFDARAGVGSPGYDPSVFIIEVNFGAGWESPDTYPQLDLDRCESEVMERLTSIESDWHAARAEAEYEMWKEGQTQ
jgi:hypothetical protein